MKHFSAVVIGLFAIGLSGFSADVRRTREALDLVTLTVQTKGSGVTNVPDFDTLFGGVTNILNLYRIMSALDLVIDSRAAAVPHQVTITITNVSRDQNAKRIEKALVEQAGIVITRLDDKRASVTHNDALPVSGLTKQEIQDITAVLMRQTTNHVVGFQRESSGDVTVWTAPPVWTAPLQAGTNAVGMTYTFRRQPSGWAIVSQKPERLHD